MILVLCAMAVAEPLVYEDALAEALEGNAGVAIARAQVEIAEGAFFASRALWDPMLGMDVYYAPMVSEGRSQNSLYRFEMSTYGMGTSLSQQYPTGTGLALGWSATRMPPSNYGFTILGQEFTEEVDTSYRTELTATITQQLLEGHRLSYNLQQVNAARRNLNISEAQFVGARQDLLLGVAQAYWDLVSATEAVASAHRAAEVAEEEQRIVRAMVEAGQLAPVEATRVAAAQAQAALNRIESESARALASDTLAVALGRDPGGGNIEPVTSPGEVPSGLNLVVQAAVEAALQGNAGVQVARIAVASAEADLTYARHALLPELEMTGTFGVSGYEEGNFSGAMEELFSQALPSHYLGLRLSAPLGNRAARGERQSKQGALSVVRQELIALERTVGQAVAAQVRTLQNAGLQVELAELNLRLAQETLAAEKARQSAGRAIQKDVLEAQRALGIAELGVVEAKTGYRKALVELQSLQGML